MQTDDILLCFECSPDTHILVSRDFFCLNVQFFSEDDESYDSMRTQRADEINNALKLPKETIVDFYNNGVPDFRKPLFIIKPYCLFIDEGGFIHQSNGNVAVKEDNIYFMKLNWRKSNDAHPIDMLKLKKNL
jgi:hypothetical protein